MMWWVLGGLIWLALSVVTALGLGRVLRDQPPDRTLRDEG